MSKREDKSKKWLLDEKLALLFNCSFIKNCGKR